jgi:hypothetical protein
LFGRAQNDCGLRGSWIYGIDQRIEQQMPFHESMKWFR